MVEFAELGASALFRGAVVNSYWMLKARLFPFAGGMESMVQDVQAPEEEALIFFACYSKGKEAAFSCLSGNGRYQLQNSPGCSI